jgi:hypothetical protein
MSGHPAQRGWMVYRTSAVTFQRSWITPLRGPILQVRTCSRRHLLMARGHPFAVRLYSYHHCCYPEERSCAITLEMFRALGRETLIEQSRKHEGQMTLRWVPDLY